MRTADFNYLLPPELIAQQPPARRTAARMMVIDRARGSLAHHRVRDLPSLLLPGDLLVVNDTRVFPARLYGHKLASGGQVEVLLIEERSSALPRSADPSGRPLRLSSTWEALLKASRFPRAGTWLELAAGLIRAEVISELGQGRALLRLQHAQPLLDILERVGTMPLPPYIKRPRRAVAEQQRQLDRARYQTIYARAPGAIAAPTAGLHFSAALLRRLQTRGIEQVAVTLHVGPGTFQPVTTAKVAAHRMEAERYEISAGAAQRIQATRQGAGRVIAVGSTVTRVLETVAAANGDLRAAQGRSRLFIYPPYNFGVVQAMLTNFHLPQSTLLMMVSAFAGRDLIRHAYATAIREQYRFYSYGDCMLIL